MPNPSTDFASLSADYPILLFPVRIETRFVASPPELLIRVYPDEIMAELHEPLTEVERQAGIDYWTAGWDPEKERDEWRRLLHHYRPQRAARIVNEMTPDNIADRLTAPEPTWDPAQVPPPPPHVATTDVLPDYWVAVAYRDGQQLYQVEGNAIEGPVSLSHRRDLGEGDPALVDHDGLEIDDDLLWTVDFDRAVQIGMAVRMPITSVDVASGFDRVIVVGVKTGLDPEEDAAVALARLFEGHHYSRGLALVPQGTPTNSSSEGASGYPPYDDPDRTFEIERGDSLLSATSDGMRLEALLGLPATAPGSDDRTFAHVEGADGLEQRRAFVMNAALWPCTLGYFLEQMMHPHLDQADLADTHSHFTKFVRGRGPLPALRVGRVPYGILPHTRITDRSASDMFDFVLRGLLDIWRTIFLDAAENVAKIGRTPGDPDADLLGILALDASCREVRLREVIGPAYAKAVFQLRNIVSQHGDFESVLANQASAVLTSAGLGVLSPRIARMAWANELTDQGARVARRVKLPMVSASPLSETELLDPNYIAWLRDASTANLKEAESSLPLLYHLLRQATLVEYKHHALEAVNPADKALYRREVEFVHIGKGTLGYKTPWDWFEQPNDNVTGSPGMPLGVWLLEPGLEQVASPAPREAVRQHRLRLGELAATPTAELDRLKSETLDTCSHRVDAWITSVATRHLEKLRLTHPVGIHLGAFGFVEDLRRKAEPEPPPAPQPPTEGGFIQAPSAAHAAAAAILRNGFLTRTGDARRDARIDLSSARTRRALSLLDGVRQGQPIGAVLGYWFERELHERQLDKFIDPFRRLYPLGNDPAEPLPDPVDGATERIAARHVVNGLALRDAVVGLDFEDLPWSEPQILPATEQDDRVGIKACLQRLDEDVDAVADLLMAESIYQVVRGNIDRSAANLETLAGGGTVPDPGIMATPRAGASVTNRVAVLLGTPQSGAPGWPSEPTPRRAAEPRLDAWLGVLLGSPDAIRCRVSYPDPGDPEARLEAEIGLDDLGLSPLDFVSIARQTGPEGGGELEPRILVHARASVAGISEPVEVHLERPVASAWPLTTLSFPEAVELARLLDELVAGARPLAPEDLQVPGLATGGEVDDEELDDRAAAAIAQLASARDDLAAAIADAQSPTPPSTLDDLRDALWASTRFGVEGAVPARLLGDDEEAREILVEQAQGVQAELERRMAAVGAAQGPVEKLHAVFGAGLPVLPVFDTDNRAELETALADSPVTDPYTARMWFLELAARVRPSLDRLRLAVLASEALVPSVIGFEVAQLPHVPGAPWVGNNFDRDLPAHRGALSLALHRPSVEVGPDEPLFSRAPGVPWAGILVDDWVEVIPDDRQLTSFAMHYDAPGAEAPQCMVLAVPPPSGGWSFGGVRDIVSETLDMAKIRAVDSDLLGSFAMLVPCIYLAANVAPHDAIRSVVADHRIHETIVNAPE